MQPEGVGDHGLHSTDSDRVMETPERHSLCIATCSCRQEEDEMYYHSDDELLGEGDTISQGSLNARYRARLHLGLPFGFPCWRQSIPSRKSHHKVVQMFS